MKRLDATAWVLFATAAIQLAREVINWRRRREDD